MGKSPQFSRFLIMTPPLMVVVICVVVVVSVDIIVTVVMIVGPRKLTIKYGQNQMLMFVVFDPRNLP